MKQKETLRGTNGCACAEFFLGLDLESRLIIIESVGCHGHAIYDKNGKLKVAGKWFWN